MARALWKGAISFGLVTIPVALYPAKSAQGDISFHLLHRDDLRRVHNKRVDEAGHEVAYEDLVKGYEYEKDRYVVVDDDDLRRANVEATQTIDIMHFVAAESIDIAYYDTPYYTEPSRAGRKAYALLREVLARSDRVGVAKIVIRERQHLCAVVADGPALLAYTLRWPYELRGSSELDLPEPDVEKLGVSQQELKMAEQLVDAMTSAWTPEEYTDSYRDDLLRLIETKVQGGEVAEETAPPPDVHGAEVVDILALLKRSIQQQKEGGGRSETRVEGGGEADDTRKAG